MKNNIKKIERIIKKILSEEISPIDKIQIGHSKQDYFESKGCKVEKDSEYRLFVIKSTCPDLPEFNSLNESKKRKILLEDPQSAISNCPGDPDCQQIGTSKVSQYEAKPGCKVGKGNDNLFYIKKSTCAGGSTAQPQPAPNNNQTGQIVKDVVKGLLNGVVDVLTGVSATVVDGVTKIAGQVVNEVSNLGVQTFEEFAKAVESAGGKAYQWGGKVWSTISSTGSGTQPKPATALPEWANQFPCLGGGVALGQGDVVTIFDKKNNVPVELYKDGNAKDTSGYMGTWECDGGMLTVSMNSKKYSQNNVGSGPSVGGSSGKKCDQSAFPDCVQSFKFDPNTCTYRSSAYDGEKNEYTVAYYNNPARTSTGVEGYYCVVFKPGSAPSAGQYLCSKVLPQIYSQFGVLEAVDQGIRRAIPSVDQAKLLADMKSIPNFLQYDASGTNLIDIDLPVLEQIVQDIQNLINQGYQGLDIGYLISFLQKVERFANGTGLTEQREIVTDALTRINGTITTFKSKDSNYNPVTNPSDLKNYNEKVIKVSYLKDNFKVYKKKLQGREDLGANVGRSNLYQQSKGYRPEDCKKYLETYLVKKNLGYMVGINTTPAGGDELEVEDLIEVIKACRTNQIYKKGILGNNRKYAEAVDFLGKESPERGGINFNEP